MLVKQILKIVSNIIIGCKTKSNTKWKTGIKFNKLKLHSMFYILLYFDIYLH